MRLPRPFVAGVALTVGAVSLSHAQGISARTAEARTATACATLRALALPNTTITVADSLSGTFTPPGTRDTIRDLPPFCRVAGEIRPTVESRIAFEVWLPLQNWNGKFTGVGNGGWAGTITYAGPPIATLSEHLRRGYAAASTNTGHEGNGGDASFAYHHPERLVDFGWRSVHEMTVKAKEVTRAFYGRAPQRAYWIGCSTGGKQGLTEAQRFPADYDGIVAGAPASVWTPLMAATFDVTLATQVDSAGYLTRPALAALHRAVLAACDTLDGLRDSLIADPRRCRFDPGTLRCATAQPAEGCLTPGQVAAVRRIYAGPVDPVTGRRIAPGLAPGSEPGWAGWATPGRPFPIPLSYYKYLVFGDTARDWKTFDLRTPSDRAAFLAADAKYAPILAATSPDLRAFRARGGKLIQYHGWDDQLITPLFSVDYYESVVARALGAGRDTAAALRDVQDFYRLFMVPGMAHCGGGPGPGVFDMQRALDPRLERGVAPDTVIATHYRDRQPDRRRPLCPYPKLAIYKGEGDVNEAATFVCRDAEK
jgi:feruloyl esterase